MSKSRIDNKEKKIQKVSNWSAEPENQQIHIGLRVFLGLSPATLGVIAIVVLIWFGSLTKER